MDNLLPHQQIALMSRWYVVSRAIHVMAKLGIADYLEENPTSIKTLAKNTNTNPDYLERLLYFLSSYEIVKQDNDGHYSLTTLSEPLRGDSPYSVKDVCCMVDDAWWESFAHLESSIKDGKSAFEHKHNTDFFAFLKSNPNRQANFDKGMAKLSQFDDYIIAKAYDFSKFTTITDLGAGRGGLSIQLATLYPHLNVTLFDSPSVIALLDKEKLSENIDCIEGDFFASLPISQAYLFKGVLHDFNEKQSLMLLKNCFQQMPKNAELFIAEQVIPEVQGPHPNKTMDIVMMGLLGGRQRTATKWQQLVNKARFKLVELIETDSLFSILRLLK
jgi:O-methyltransferase domain